MTYVERHPFRSLLKFPTVFAVVLICLFSFETNAQDGDSSCPCFSREDVESIFQRGAQLAADEGTSNCIAEDYSVEIKAEVAIWNLDYVVIARASVAWFDFDPGNCEYIDPSGNPGVERNVRWPHPAPEATARACFDIISEVIAKSDTSGRCNTYP